MSEQYIVSARKYRPQTFDTVVGQQHITETLKNAIRSQQIAHAYLFCGPRGVGKTTCARILAKTINCTNITADAEACGQCESCHAFNENSSFNIFELDAASNNKVEDMRNLIEQVRYPPHQGKYKIYIIDEAHMLTSQAFNAFLKTLEEPPAYAIFILATTEKHKILPTILSRCQIFDFKRIKNLDIAEHLLSITSKEHTTADMDALHLIARTSEGCMRDALSIMDRVASAGDGHISYRSTIEQLNLLDADIYFRFINAFVTQNHAQVLMEFDALLQKGFEGHVVLEGLLEQIRNIILCKNVQTAQLLDVSETHRAKYYQYAQRLSEDYLITLLNLLHECDFQYNVASNKRLHVEIVLIKCCYLSQLVSVNQLPHDVIDSKKKITEPISSQSIKKEEINTDADPESHTLKREDRAPVASAIIPPSDLEIKEREIEKPNVAVQTTGSVKMGSSLLNSLKEKNRSQLEARKEIIELNEDMLRESVDSYVRTLESSGRDLIKNHIQAATFSCTDASHIQCICTQNLQFNSLNSIKQDIVNILVTKTNNPQIKINIELDLKEEIVITKDIMTKHELLEELTSKNPSLKELVQSAQLTPVAKFQLKNN